MLDAFLLQIVRWFIERQVMKWGKALDWTKVKSDLEIRVKALVPGDQFDSIAAYLAGMFVDVIAEYFKDNAVPLDSPQMPQILGQAFQYGQTVLLRKVAEAAVTLGLKK
jgi:hypothetical protein